jgi:hypothetical protein
VQIEQLINPADLVGFVRGVALEANAYQFGLVQFFPEENVEEIEFRFTRGQMQDVDAATYRNWDSPAPIARRLGGQRVTGTIAPISRKIRLGEEERLRQQALQTGDVSQLRNKVYDDAANLTRSCLARVELARGKVLETAQLVLNENGVVGTLDMGRSNSMTVTAGTLWSDLANSDPINDLLVWQQAYFDLNLALPAVILMPGLTTINNLIRNQKIRNQVGTLLGAPTVVQRAQLNALLASHNLPPIVGYMGRVRVAGTQVRILPDNKLFLLPAANEPMARTFVGQTIESLNLAGQGFVQVGQTAGVVATAWTSEDPVGTWTKASYNAVPFLANPNLAMVATVG